MNIALIITQKLDPDAGGVQRTTSKLVKIFKSHNHGVIIISIGNFDNYQEQFERTSLYYLNRRKSEGLTDILKNNDVDVIINQMGYSVGLTKLILKNKPPNTKVVNTLRINPLNFYDNHKEFVSSFLLNKGLTILNNKISHKLILLYHIAKQRIELDYIIKNTNAFVMLSEYFKKELYFLAPGLKKYDYKIHGIGNPFERPEIGVKKNKKENIILFVGRLNIIQKRVNLLLQIWEKLHLEHIDWQFWVVGDGESKSYMEKFCSEHALDRITFFGKDNPHKYYKKAKIFHMTSAFEGFGNVLVEAQSHGCVPILFNSYAAAQDIVGHCVNGILVEAFDINRYVDQTKELMNNPSKLNHLSINAIENVNKFSYEETYKKWHAVFKTIN